MSQNKGTRKIYRDSTFSQRIFFRSNEYEIESVTGKTITTKTTHCLDTGDRVVLAFKGCDGDIFKTLATVDPGNSTQFTVPDDIPDCFEEAWAFCPIALTGTPKVNVYSYPDKNQALTGKLTCSNSSNVAIITDSTAFDFIAGMTLSAPSAFTSATIEDWHSVSDSDRYGCEEKTYTHKLILGTAAAATLTDNEYFVIAGEDSRNEAQTELEYTHTTFTGDLNYGEVEFAIPVAEINALKSSNHLLQMLLSDGLLYYEQLTFTGEDNPKDRLDYDQNTHSIELLGGNTIAPGDIVAQLVKVDGAFTIPASGGVTVVTDPVDAFGDGQSESVVIQQIVGTLSRSGSTVTFTRAVAGSAVNVADGSLISFVNPNTNQLGANPNGLNIVSGGLNLGDANSIDFPVPLELNGNELIDSSLYPFELVDGSGTPLFAVTSNGEILLPDGIGGANVVNFSSANGLYSIADENGNTLFQITNAGQIKVPFGQIASGMVLDFRGEYLFDYKDQSGNSAARLTKEGILQVGRLEALSSNISGGETTPVAVEPAWNELSDFWQGYAPIGAATSSYTSVATGSPTTTEADDFAMRQNFLIQYSTKSIRAYFDHTSDHITNFRLDGSGWTGAPADMKISWGIGFANGNSPNAVLGASTFKRGLINGSPRPTVDIHFAGWSDPIYLDVAAPDCLTVGTAQNVQGAYRLIAPEGATGDAIQGAAQGGFLTDPETRWTNATSPAPSVITSDSAGTAGFRFLAAERPVDRMICVVSDSIARGIIYASKPDPYLSAGNWPGLLEASLGDRVGVWHQGAGGSRMLAYGQNDRWFERTLNCTHLVITGGTNDIADGRTSVQIQASLNPRIKIARDMGIKVILATIIPRNPFSASQNTQRGDYNAWVRSNPYDGVLDFDAAIRDSGNPDLIASAYNGGDGIHPNEQGHQAMFLVINQSLFN